MPKVTMNLPDDLISKIAKLGDNTDSICEKALKAGAEVVEKQVSANLNAVIGKNTVYESRSTGQLMAALGITPVLVDRNGNYNIKIGFAENRHDGVSNTMLANIFEYGKVGVPPKPFMKSAKSKSKKPALDKIKSTFKTEIDKL